MTEQEQFDDPEWLRFCDRMKIALSKYIGLNINTCPLGHLNAVMESVFATWRVESSEPLLPAPGMEIWSASAVQDRISPDLVKVKWRTRFWPASRHDAPQSTHALGFYGQYDLYVGIDRYGPPSGTAVIYAGNGERLLSRGYMQHDGSPAYEYGPDHDEMFAVAYARAAFCGHLPARKL